VGERWTSGGTGDRETPALFTTLPACSPCTPPSVKTPSLASVQYIKMVDPAADLRPDHWQLVTLIVIGVYVLLIMFVWNLPGVKSVLYPFKVLTVAFHEVRNRTSGCCGAPHTAWFFYK
jgi:hypothetical protein